MRPRDDEVSGSWPRDEVLGIVPTFFEQVAYTFTMPTVLRILGFRFHFYSDEGTEPPHIHVETGDGECKFWLTPVVLARNRGISPVDVRKVERLVYEHQKFLLEKYDDFQSE